MKTLNLNVEERLIRIDLSKLYSISPEDKPETEPGLIIMDILKIYGLNPLVVISTSPDIPDYIIHVNANNELMKRIDELLIKEKLDLEEIAKKILLEEDEDLISIILFDGYDSAIAFVK